MDGAGIGFRVGEVMYGITGLDSRDRGRVKHCLIRSHGRSGLVTRTIPSAVAIMLAHICNILYAPPNTSDFTGRYTLLQDCDYLSVS